MRKLNKSILVGAIALSTMQLSQIHTAGAADYLVKPSIHKELAEHTKHFAQKVYKIGSNVYSAVGWGLGNTIMIVGTNGVIIVDTGVNLAGAASARDALRQYSDKPVKAIVYTHFHPDHWGGVGAWTTPEEVKSGKVEIIAHDTLLDNVVLQGGTVGAITAMRTGYSFGVFLPPEDVISMNDGIGPKEMGGSANFIAPTKTFADKLDLTISGVKIQLQHVPSEADDEIVAYLPKENILLSAEVIQGPTLPNIHTIRGVTFRNPVKWYKGIDRLRDYKAAAMVPAHGQPVMGIEKVEEVLRMTRDGIQYIHDQTVRYMNKGMTPDELAEKIKFPPHLANYKPYLREYYGTVKHSVRQIYQGYLGWFQGDPVELDPTPRTEKTNRQIKLMGGRDTVLNEAVKAYEAGDNQWAAELATFLIRSKHEDKDARQIKAAAFRKLGYASMNTNWRNWYLVSAMELEGKIEPMKSLVQIIRQFASPDVIAQWPASRLIGGMAYRLKGEKTQDLKLTAGFHFTDTNEAVALEIRNGIAQFHSTPPNKTDFTLILPKPVFLGIGAGKIKLNEALKKGMAKLEGNPKKLPVFFASFDPAFSSIELTVR